jgi:hypothetical protein
MFRVDGEIGFLEGERMSVLVVFVMGDIDSSRHYSDGESCISSPPKGVSLQMDDAKTSQP